MRLRVALAQIGPVLGSVQANVDRALALIAGARSQADLVVFPELALTGYCLEDPTAVALKLDSPELLALAEASRETAVAVGFVEEAPGYVWYNSAAVFVGGRLAHLQRKIYPPTYGRFEEGKHFARGSSLRCFDFRGWRVAVLICADWWHPSLPYLAAAQGADLLVAMAASPAAGLGSRYDTREGWYRLNRTYASLYGAYVAFCNRTGREGDTCFWGGSELVDPFGGTVQRAGEGEAWVQGTLDPAVVREVRRLLPTMRDEDLSWTARNLARIAAWECKGEEAVPWQR